MGEFHRGPHLKTQNTSVRKFALLVIFSINFPVFKDVWVRVLPVDKSFFPSLFAVWLSVYLFLQWSYRLLWNSLACCLVNVLWGLQIIFAQLLAQRVPQRMNHKGATHRPRQTPLIIGKWQKKTMRKKIKLCLKSIYWFWQTTEAWTSPLNYQCAALGCFNGTF